MRRRYGIQIEGEHRPADVPNERWSRSRYEEAVEATLEQIVSTLVGRLVVRFAEMQRRSVRVFPQTSLGRISRHLCAYNPFCRGRPRLVYG